MNYNMRQYNIIVIVKQIHKSQKSTKYVTYVLKYYSKL